MGIEEEIRETANQLIRALNVKSSISEPISVGDRLVLLVSKSGVGFGAAAGGGNGKGSKSGGTGGAAATQPVAAITITPNVPGPEGFSIVPLETPNPLAKAVAETLDTVMDALRQRKVASESDEAKTETGTG